MHEACLRYGVARVCVCVCERARACGVFVCVREREGERVCISPDIASHTQSSPAAQKTTHGHSQKFFDFYIFLNRCC